jgi:phospholipid transport system substrate-binding protein
MRHTLRGLAGALRILILAVCLPQLAAAAETPEPQGPTDVIRATVDDVLAVLQEPGLSTQERRHRIEEIAYGRFHFETISRLVLARQWKRFTPEQRDEFMREFRLMLSQSYGRRIDRYEQEKVDVRDARDEARGDVTVRTRIVGGQADGIEMDYRLRKKNDTWYVIDVSIEGVSLVSSYRSQFSEVLGQGGPNELLRRLKAKNAKGGEPEAAAASAGGA